MRLSCLGFACELCEAVLRNLCKAGLWRGVSVRKKNNMPSLKIISLGCSKNTVDSEVIAGNVKAAGWTILREESPRAADVTLINTCGFILDAKQESIDTVLAEVARKNRRKRGKVYVMGCLVQRYGKELEKEIPGVDVWRGVNDLNAVVDAILQVPVEADATIRKLSTPRHNAYLKVSEGCNRQCSFCAIPLIRGKQKSRPKEEILKEARKLAAQGVREVILVAQDLCNYGTDLYGRKDIAALVKELCRIDFRHTNGKNAVNLIRGLSPYPGAYFEICKNAVAGTETRDGTVKTVTIKVFNAEFVSASDEAYSTYVSGDKRGGDMVSDGKHYLGVTVADGIVLLKDIQMSGKKRMDTEAFLLGFREPESYSIV